MNVAIEDLANRLFRAIEESDVEAARACYAPEVVVWHNIDQATQDCDQSVEVLRRFIRYTQQRHYDNVRRTCWADGFVQQHTLRVVTRDGREVHIEACIVAATSNGQITRLDEYLDSAALAVLAPPALE